MFRYILLISELFYFLFFQDYPRWQHDIQQQNRMAASQQEAVETYIKLLEEIKLKEGNPEHVFVQFPNEMINPYFFNMGWPCPRKLKNPEANEIPDCVVDAWKKACEENHLGQWHGIDAFSLFEASLKWH